MRFGDKPYYKLVLQSPTLASRLIKGVVEDFATEEKALEITDFFRANPIIGTERIVQLAVESVRINENWIKREKNLLSLKEYMEVDTTTV
jgi:puromycin-sensitive aminopeptidase